MRFDSAKSITGSPGESEVGPQLGGGDDFLSRANAFVINLKEMLKMAQEIRGMGGPGASGPGPGPGGGFDKETIVKIIDLVIAKGWGDATIGDIISQASPITIKQLRGIIEHAGFGK